MKSGKSSGLSGVINEHFILSSHGLEALYRIANEILGHSMMPDSTVIAIYKGKGSVIERSCGTWCKRCGASYGKEITYT